MNNASLRAGAAIVDITPAMGVQLAGDIGRHRPVEEIRDSLFARVLVLEAGGQRCAVVSLDIIAITKVHNTSLRQLIAERTGLPAEAVMIHCVQNHAAPGIGHEIVEESVELPEELWYIRGGDDRYIPVVFEAVATALERALAVMQPVTMKVGRATDGRVAFNRRFIMRDGNARTHPPQCSPEIVYCEGPMDPEVSLAVFENADGQAVAALLHHTCHPVHGYPQRWVSGGWPGAWARGMQGVLGEDCVPLVLNGFCGNIHHNNHLDPDFVDDYLAMGRKLTETGARIVAQLTPMPVTSLTCLSRTLAVPYRTLDPAQFVQDDRYLAEHPEPIWIDRAAEAVEWEWVYAHSRLGLRRRIAAAPAYELEVQAFRLGEVAILGAEGEPFVEGQLEVKLHSPAAYTLMAHMTNGCAGYIPTKLALRNGGYETRPGTWSMFCPDALEMLAQGAREVLDEMFVTK